MTVRAIGRFLRDADGATAVEFALVAPALLTMLFGLFDLGHNMYTAQMLQGAIQKSARDSTIEGAASSSAQLDAFVTKAVRAIAPGASLSFSRKSYAVARPEDFTDLNANSICDNGEAFEDVNANGTWDKDVGKDGLGSARDAVLYTVTVTYNRLFPTAAFIPGQSKSITMAASTVLRNQPYGQQDVVSPKPGNCT
jgi:Flp pilus assembly protein TadG